MRVGVLLVAMKENRIEVAVLAILIIAAVAVMYILGAVAQARTLLTITVVVGFFLFLAAARDAAERRFHVMSFGTEHPAMVFIGDLEEAALKADLVRDHYSTGPWRIESYATRKEMAQAHQETLDELTPGQVSLVS